LLNICLFQELFMLFFNMHNDLSSSREGVVFS
jgi:hypothetical protein